MPLPKLIHYGSQYQRTYQIDYPEAANGNPITLEEASDKNWTGNPKLMMLNSMTLQVYHTCLHVNASVNMIMGIPIKRNRMVYSKLFEPSAFGFSVRGLWLFDREPSSLDDGFSTFELSRRLYWVYLPTKYYEADTGNPLVFRWIILKEQFTPAFEEQAHRQIIGMTPISVSRHPSEGIYSSQIALWQSYLNADTLHDYYHRI